MGGVKYYYREERGMFEFKVCCDSLHSNKAHFHEELSIGLIEKGSSRVEIDGEEHMIMEKSAVVIPPDMVHKCSPIDHKHWDFKMAYINRDWLEHTFAIQCSQIDFSHINLGQESYGQARRLFEAMEGPQWDIDHESKFIKAVWNMVIPQDTSTRLYERQEKTSKEMKEIRAFLHEHYLENIMLEDLVHLTHLSKYYMIRKFEQQYGLSPHQYLTALRINQAKQLLKTHRDIPYVAVLSGFYDQSHFTKSFKQYMGMTPRRYLESLS